ncbi:MAG TPA: hypothetical protein VFY41_06610 [Nitrososphaeraceae archaeon]|nr:hypothetical protein [Nitrososphaeraceae archaeon]
MKRFSQFKLKKELIILFAVGVILLLDYAFPAYYNVLLVQAQLQQQPSPIIGIKITSPVADQQVPAGELTISGTSTDNATTDCTVYADWNNLKPFQKAIATGPGGVNDYSTWTFTYTDDYHLIANGTNNLTSKLSCVDESNFGTANLTKNYSIDVIGIATTKKSEAAAVSTQGEVQKQQQSFAIDNNSSLINGMSNTDNNNATTLDNETKVVIEEEIPTANNNISKPSIPMPIVAKSYFDPNTVNVNITSPIAGQQVPAGNLTVTGISSDNSTTDCQVWLGWNEQKPFQKAIATGPAGVNDYSRWNFTYTPQYHIITNGTNDLGAQISCFNSDTLANITKSYSVNVTGIIESSEQSALGEQNVSSSLPSIKIDNDDNKTAATTIPPPQIIPSVPTTSPLPLQPAIKDDEEKEQTEEEPEPESESEPQPTTSPTGDDDTTEDDTTEDDTDEEENTSEQETEVEEVQEEEEVQEQLQQILEKVGKVEEEVQQEVGKVEEDILEEIESGLR